MFPLVQCDDDETTELTDCSEFGPTVDCKAERPKTNKAGENIVDLTDAWFSLEVGFNMFFTIELIVKLVVYPDLSQWFLGSDAIINLVDVISITPFWLELVINFQKYRVRSYTRALSSSCFL